MKDYNYIYSLMIDETKDLGSKIFNASDEEIKQILKQLHNLDNAMYWFNKYLGEQDEK
jgi:hypothetical protein